MRSQLQEDKTLEERKNDTGRSKRREGEKKGGKE
jgi:hypothetical protein